MVTEDLVAFLRQHLDREERDALAVIDGFGSYDDAGGKGYSDVDGMPPREYEHITRWDPARVLAEVGAKRRIVDAHTPTSGGLCPTCWEGAEWGGPAASPCPTLRLLAQPYAGRDGWREEWRVDGPS